MLPVLHADTTHFKGNDDIPLFQKRPVQLAAVHGGMGCRADRRTDSTSHSEITENQNDTPIEFVKAANQPVIDFKIEGVDLESINEFLVSLLSQNEANSALFDANMLNTLLLIPKLLKHTKGSTKYDSDAFIKNLMNKYFTDGKLNKPEKLIIDAVIKLSNAVYINIDGNNNTIRLINGSSAKITVDALN